MSYKIVRVCVRLRPPPLSKPSVILIKSTRLLLLNDPFKNVFSNLFLQMDDSIPPHLRFSSNNGYDDFHKSYQQISQQFPNKHFPVFGPPK